MPKNKKISDLFGPKVKKVKQDESAKNDEEPNTDKQIDTDNLEINNNVDSKGDVNQNKESSQQDQHVTDSANRGFKTKWLSE